MPILRNKPLRKDPTNLKRQILHFHEPFSIQPILNSYRMCIILYNIIHSILIRILFSKHQRIQHISLPLRQHPLLLPEDLPFKELNRRTQHKRMPSFNHNMFTPLIQHTTNTYTIVLNPHHPEKLLIQLIQKSN